MSADKEKPGRLRAGLGLVPRGEAKPADKQTDKARAKASDKQAEKTRAKAAEAEAPPQGRAARALVWAREFVRSPEGREYLAPALLGLAVSLLLTPHPFRMAAIPSVLGAAVLSAVLLRLAWLVWYRHIGHWAGARPSQDKLFLLCLLALMLVCGRGTDLWAWAVTEPGGAVTAASLGFAAPLWAGPMLAAVFLGLQTAVVVSMVGGLLASLFWPDPSGMFLYYFLGGIVAAYYARQGRARLSTVTAGLWGAFTGAVVVAGLALMRGWLISVDFPTALGCVLFCGLASGIMVTGLIPVAEMAFGFVSDFRLMELASLDHPVLQELMLRAPGTYHHSLVVSSLVESAAREIGARPMLAKVASLYHDLGKIKKADYFVENQLQAAGRHEKLAPSMSALILTSHVKEGVDMARRHRLGQPIIDIIAQHHGTRLIHFFYHKAAESRRAAGQPEPDPQAFRYPGPRPQTREAGLVMLADTVEAACRSLDNPTPSRLQGVVQTQINKIFTEGELEECELTLKDLHKIAKIFNKILAGIFHSRVEYPDAEDKAKKKNEPGDRQPPKSDGDKPKEPRKQDGGDIKRLGLV